MAQESSQPSRRPAVYADLFELPDNRVGEILDGGLVTHPRPAPRHARASSALGVRVGGPFDQGIGGPGGWWILDAPELHLGADVLVPDLAGWPRERLAALPDTAWFELAPDWVCEVLSPATRCTDRVVKMPLYARSGVGWLWLVDPDERMLEAYALRDGRWVLLDTLADERSVALAPFDAAPFSLAALWV